MNTHQMMFASRFWNRIYCYLAIMAEWCFLLKPLERMAYRKFLAENKKAHDLIMHERINQRNRDTARYL